MEKSLQTTGDDFAVVKPQNNNSEALVHSTAAREVAEVQAGMVIAKKFPRDEQNCVNRILTSCQRPGLAEGALYQYARGGTNITGPSIRLAEAIAQNWQNISFGVRELEQRDGISTVEAFALDLETNTRQTKTFQVAHKRHTKARGSYNLTDPRDIYEMVANQGARRLRACILGIIPGDVVDAAVEQCNATLKLKADVTPEALKKMLEAFAPFGVTKEQIEKRIQRNLDSITPAQKVALGNIYTSLKDGMSSVGDWFEVTEVPGETVLDKKSGTEKAKAAMKNKKTAVSSKKEPTKTEETQKSGESESKEEVAKHPAYDLCITERGCSKFETLSECPNSGAETARELCDLWQGTDQTA